ncbi:MAG: sel1 repeat family protein [Deltaproteobacteria bacterium]|jgi:TPR repeat protein|nr:sel1 repeat family protein [Deltaproteobacteria bacterium]
MIDLGELQDKAEAGDARALYELGLVHADGLRVEKDLERAVFYFRRAYELGLDEPIYALARAYEEGGEGLDRDPIEAFFWWRQGAHWGRTEAVALACHKVGRAYAEGTVVVRDRLQAISWLEKAIDGGQTEAQALLNELKSQQD